MADEKLTALADATAIADTDLVAMVKDMGTTPTTVSRAWSLLKSTLKTYFDTLYGSSGGAGWDGQIVVTVATNDITVALKTLAGDDPSAGTPVHIRIGNVEREITAALSVTAVDATNWCNAGSAELAAKEIDYFVYLGYNATDGVVIGFSRIPYAHIYSDFSATTTNEKFCKISTITTAAAGDDYVNIGRFAATLSAAAGHVWTVPTFTAANLIQRPIYETRMLSYLPTWNAATPPAIVNGTIAGKYILRGRMMWAEGRVVAGASTTFGTGVYTFSWPFTPSAFTSAGWIYPAFVFDASANIFYLGTMSGAAAAAYQMFTHGAVGAVSATVPVTLVSGDVMHFAMEAPLV